MLVSSVCTVLMLVSLTFILVLQPPLNITVKRSITGRLLITWSGVTDARGFVHSYLIMSGRGEMYTVPYNTTSLLLASVGDVYAFRIATVNEERAMGHWSEWITNAGGKNILQ